MDKETTCTTPEKQSSPEETILSWINNPAYRNEKDGAKLYTASIVPESR